MMTHEEFVRSIVTDLDSAGRIRARERNAGWRIDYFLVSDRISDKVNDAFIFDQVTGSDHCPVGLDLTW